MVGEKLAGFALLQAKFVLQVNVASMNTNRGAVVTLLKLGSSFRIAGSVGPSLTLSQML